MSKYKLWLTAWLISHVGACAVTELVRLKVSAPERVIYSVSLELGAAAREGMFFRGGVRPISIFTS